MDDKLFDELLESVREGGAILRGEREASRIFDAEEPAGHCASAAPHSRETPRGDPGRYVKSGLTTDA